MTSHFEIVRAKELKYAAMRAEYDARSAAKKEALSAIMGYIRPAFANDYREFLGARTKPCTHFYGYNMPSGGRGGFYVAKRDFALPSLCGSNAIHVIVPHWVNVEHARTGPTHCNIYRMISPDASLIWVPSYNDAHQSVRAQ